MSDVRACSSYLRRDTLGVNNGRTPASLEEQIPGWKPGTIEFPDYFLSNPLISVPNIEGKLVKSLGLMGIELADEKIERRPRSVSGQHALAVQPCYTTEELEGFKPAICKRPSGERYIPPPHIRGVLTNDF